MVEAAGELFLGVGLPAPAIDLRPAGDSRLDPMAGEIALDDLGIKPVAGLGLQGMGPRPDQRKGAVQDIEELRQLVDAPFAHEAADPGDPLIIAAYQTDRVGIAGFDMHRAEFVNLDQLVVEAVALLAEQHRTAAVELDR